MKYTLKCKNEKCGKEFISYKSNQKNCSRSCRSESGRRVVKCRQCGDFVTKDLYDIKKTKHSFCNSTCKGLFYCKDKSNLYNQGERYLVESTGMSYVWCKDKYRAEHRVLVEAFIGRALVRWGEPILHINGRKSDNNLDNLYVCSSMSEMKKILTSYDAPYPYKSNLNQIKKGIPNE